MTGYPDELATLEDRQPATAEVFVDPVPASLANDPCRIGRTLVILVAQNYAYSMMLD